MYELVNVVGGGRVSTELDLHELMERLDAQYKSYEPESFAALVLRFEVDSPTIILFSNGKYNIAGAASVDELLDSKEKIVDKLEVVG